MKKIVVWAAAPLLAFSLAPLAACSSSAIGSTSDTQSQPAEETVQLKTLGTAEDGDNVYTVSITNGTGKNITGFAMKYDGQDAYGKNLLSDGDVFEADEERSLSYDMTDALNSVNASSMAEGEATTYPAIYAQLTYEDGSTAELHDLPLVDAQDLTVKCTDVICYVDYTQQSSGNDASTKNEEQGIYDKAQADAKAAADAQAQAEADAKAAAEAQAATEAQAEADAKAAREAQSQQSASSSYSSGSSYSDSSSSSGSSYSGTSSSSASAVSSSNSSSAPASCSASSGNASSGSGNSSANNGCMGGDVDLY